MSIKSNVLNYLKEGHTLSELDGWKLFNTLNVRNRISELRQEGYNIKDKTEYNKATKKHYSIYWLSDEPVKTEQETIMADNFHKQEEKINYREVNKQLEMAI